MLTRTHGLLAQNATAKPVIALLILLSLPSTVLAADKQSITCRGQGGDIKHIYVEHSPTNSNVCRTLYSPNGAQFKAIAWAQKSSQKCYAVANKLAARFQHSGLDCGLTANVPVMDKPIADNKLAATNTAILKTMPVRRKAKPSIEEQVEEPTPADTELASEEEILKTIER